MSLSSIIYEVNNHKSLKLNSCSALVTSGYCNWDCCVYTDSYCLLLPGEYEIALDFGFNFDGYEIIDTNYFNGKKITPTSKTCCVGADSPEGSYKSLDCWFYPYWPVVKNGELKLIAGNLCPLRSLNNEEVNVHKEHIRIYAQTLITDECIRNFLSNAKMTGYSNEEEWK